MNAKDLIQLLTLAFKTHRQVLIVSPPGQGKTAIVKHVAQVLGFDMILRHPAIEDPTDSKGAPWVWVTDEGQTRATFVAFDDLHNILEAKRPTVLFLDDFGHAKGDVMAAYTQWLGGRQINDRKMSEHVVTCAATNDTMHQSGVKAIIEPIKSRFDTIVRLTVTPEEWIDWAMANHVHPDVITFLSAHVEHFNTWKPSKDLLNQAMPRTWEKASNLIRDGIDPMTPFGNEVLSGTIGSPAATCMRAFLEHRNSLPKFEQLMKEPSTAMLPSEPYLQYAVVSILASGLYGAKDGPAKLDALQPYLLRMLQCMRVLTLKLLIKSDMKFVRTATFQGMSANRELEL